MGEENLKWEKLTKLKDLLEKVSLAKNVESSASEKAHITGRKEEPLPMKRKPKNRVLKMARWGLEPKRLGAMLILWLVVPLGIVVVIAAIVKKWRQLSQKQNPKPLHEKRKQLQNLKEIRKG